MVDDTIPRSQSRRRVLEVLGTGLLGASIPGAVNASSADGQSNEDQSGPTGTIARVIRRVEPAGDQMIIHKRAVSPQFNSQFGGPVVEYEPVYLPREVVPKKYHGATVERAEQLVVGTMKQHVFAEEQQAKQINQACSTADLSSSGIYTGPYHVYESATGAEEKDLYERTAPINVAWGKSTNHTAFTVRDFMESNGWTPVDWMWSGDRYIFHDGEAFKQDEHIYKEIFESEQWHIRVYDVNVTTDPEELVVIGNAHHDPLDHNYRPIYEDPWDFDSARDETLQDWDSWGLSTTEVPWGVCIAPDFETFDGNVGVVYY